MFASVFILVSVSCFFAGVHLETARVCYGSDYNLPSHYGVRLKFVQLFFKPAHSSRKILVSDKLEIKDPRYIVTYGTLSITDITERDNGIFFLMPDGGRLIEILRLEVIECSSKVVLTYGSSFSQSVVSEASTLDFLTLGSSSKPAVLWNKFDEQAGIDGMGQMRGSTWLVTHVTQKHQGHYTFRKQNGRFLSRRKLEVKENFEGYTKESGEDLIVHSVLNSEESCYLELFLDEEPDPITLIRNGGVVPDEYISDRVEILGRRSHFTFKIGLLEERDSGRLELRDQNSNLALVIRLKVKPHNPWMSYVSVGGSVIALVCFCCCVRKCCCKKNSSKRNNSASETGQAALHPAETRHMTSQPPGPSHPSPPYFQQCVRKPAVTIPPAAPSGPMFSYQPTPPPPPNPSSINETTHNEDPQVQVATSTGVDPPSFHLNFCLSSESETQYELPQKLNFRTALVPIAGASSSAEVYSSDKLNFK